MGKQSRATRGASALLPPPLAFDATFGDMCGAVPVPALPAAD
ncbi:MAG: hypothetical protein OXF27_00975 [Acidobacteria bacterium]|nr:hypothetical protein [Acidobacteriota bacterium]